MVVFGKRWWSKSGNYCLKNGIAENKQEVNKQHVFFCHFLLFCLLPVGVSVNIWAIPRYGILQNLRRQSDLTIMKYISAIPFFRQMSPVLLHHFFPIDHHCERQSEFFAIAAFVRIVWSSCKVSKIEGCVHIALLRQWSQPVALNEFCRDGQSASVEFCFKGTEMKWFQQFQKIW